MGGLLLGAKIAGYRSDACSVSVYAPQFASRVWRVENDSLASPTAATRSQDWGQHLWSASRCRHLQQFSIGEECDCGAIGSPEGITCPFASLNHFRFGRADALNEEHRQSRVLIRRDKRQHGTVG